MVIFKSFLSFPFKKWSFNTDFSWIVRFLLVFFVFRWFYEIFWFISGLLFIFCSFFKKVLFLFWLTWLFVLSGFLVEGYNTFVFRLKLFILGWRFCISFGCWFGFLRERIYIRCLFDMWIKFFCSDTSSVVSLKFIGCFGRLSLDTLSWGGPTGWSSSRCESLKVQIGWLFFVWSFLVGFGHFWFWFQEILVEFVPIWSFLFFEFLVNKVVIYIGCFDFLGMI